MENKKMAENTYCRYVAEPPVEVAPSTYNASYYEKPSFEADSSHEYHVLFEKFPVEGPLLDYGCGPGVFLKAAREKGIAEEELFGVDVSPSAVEAARRKGFANVRVIEMNVAALPFADATFQTVVTTQVLEHITHQRVPAVLDELIRVLKPGGLLLVFCPAEWSAVDNQDPTHITFLKVGWFRRRMINQGMHELAFDSLTRLPPVLMRFGPLSYLAAKALYKLTMQRPTVIEYAGVKRP